MNIVLLLGLVLLAGSLGGALARTVQLPSVTGYLLAGIVIGPSALGVVPYEMLTEFNPINDVALGVIALSIGAELRLSNLRYLGKNLSTVFGFEAGLTFLSVLVLTRLVGASWNFAVILAVLGIATAPGAILACIRESGSQGRFSRALLAVVALDNLLAIGIFGLAVSLMQPAVSAYDGPALALVGNAASKIGLAMVIGFVAGWLLAIVTRRTNDSRILVAALATILITVGLAKAWDVSALLATMSAGAFFINVSKAPQKVFRQLQVIEGPILLAFLTLAGVKLDLSVVPTVGLVGGVYIAARALGKLVGSRIGAHFTDFPKSWQGCFGQALMPQAGVAIGLAIIAEQKLPFASATITTIILGAVVVFEIVGPLLVKRALYLTDEVE